MTRTFVETAGKLVRNYFEDVVVGRRARARRRRCRSSSTAHLLTTQIAFTLTGPASAVDSVIADIQAGASSSHAVRVGEPHTDLIAVAALEVHGPNVRLRIPRDTDSRRLFELASDPEVTRFFSWGPYQTEEDARAWLATLAARRESGEALELAIVDRDDWLIGIIAVLEVSKRDRRAVVGIWLGQAYWGTGASAEAEALLAHLVFGPLRMERLARLGRCAQPALAAGVRAPRLRA